MRFILQNIVVGLSIVCVMTSTAFAQTTAFSYQGKLTDAGNPANGNYDLQIRLFDTATPGTGVQQGSTLIRNPVTASAGIFTVTLDFAANVFDGAARFLEIGLRPVGSPNPYTVLAPRQPITSSPYAIQTLNAQQLGGLAANRYVATDSNGNVGIGTSTPSQKFQVNGTSALGGPAGVYGFSLNGTSPGPYSLLGFNAYLNASATAFIGGVAGYGGVLQLQDGDGTFGFYSSDSSVPVGTPLLPVPRFEIDKNGNIGIGTPPSAGNRLDVNGPVLFRTGGSGGGFFSFQAPNGETGFTINGNGTNRADLRFDGSWLKLVASAAGIPPSTNGIAVNTAGNVGIGTINNTNITLQVAGGSNDIGIRANTNDISSSVSAIVGSSSSGFGVLGLTTFGRAVYGTTTGPGYAGYFDGKVRVVGVLEKPGGGFKIDHPLDPENKYLIHSFVESPDMKNLYDGVVTTDVTGEAAITLPDWFSALNRDFRYQLTCIGVFAQAIIAEKIKDNRFKIKTSLPNVEVSWQVTGTRQDAWANQNRLQVEELKPDVERGSYQNPAAFGQPDERSSEWARNPILMREQKERREHSSREAAKKTAATSPLPNQ